MSRTDKDKRWSYRTDEEKNLPSRKKRSGRANLVKGFESGPGGKECFCCGVESLYKSHTRAQGKAEAVAGYLEYLEQVV